uniref:Polygalacturonase n=1 Tax=Arcella intermedia TaxID=1963864 RepID=A0A6B2LAA7_9EUKA
MANWPLSNNQYQDFLTLSNCNNCLITGGGLIDGQGTPWYIAFDNGELDYRRPNLLVIKKCVDLKLLDIDILNSPMFNVVLSGVKGAEIGFVNITDEWYNDGASEPHNTDGIDPGSDSAGIHIHDVYIYNGDDSVAVKPGTIAGGCTRDILVENCEFHRGHGASIGSIGSGCIQNVTFRNITFYDQMGAVVVKTYNEDVGFVKNITWKDLVMYNTDHCVNINTNYKTTGNPPQLLISGLNLVNIVGDKCAYPAHFVCQMEKPCMDISLVNVDLLKNAKEKTMLCEYAHGTAHSVQPSSCLLP